MDLISFKRGRFGFGFEHFGKSGFGFEGSTGFGFEVAWICPPLQYTILSLINAPGAKTWGPGDS